MIPSSVVTFLMRLVIFRLSACACHYSWASQCTSSYNSPIPNFLLRAIGIRVQQLGFRHVHGFFYGILWGNVKGERMLSDGYSSAGDIWGAEKKSVVLAGSLVTAQNKLLPHLEACHVQAIHNDASRSIKAYA